MDSIFYPELGGIRTGQVELEYYKGSLIIRLFEQTEEEAGGVGPDRKALLPRLEGQAYLHNGQSGIYSNVGKCSGAPREYAVQTLLITGINDTIPHYAGDVDSDILVGE